MGYYSEALKYYYKSYNISKNRLDDKLFLKVTEIFLCKVIFTPIKGEKLRLILEERSFSLFSIAKSPKLEKLISSGAPSSNCQDRVSLPE